jgi:hypothetical protein
MSKGYFRRSKVFWTVLLILIASLTVVMLVGVTAAETVGTPIIVLDPTSPVVGVGANVNVDIRLDNFTNVYGGQIEMSFDETIVQVSGDKLTPGSCPAPDFVQSNNADNVNGVISYVVTQLNPTTPCNGGVMATIDFLCVAEGVSDVTFTSSIISDADANPIIHTGQNGTVECEQSVIEFIGEVALQSWPDPAGVEVTLYDSQGLVDGPVVVDSSGTFSLVADDESETYRVVAAYDRYLSAEASGLTGTGGTVIDLGLTTLRAGDINGDGVINILDLTALAGNFNKTSPQAWAP